MADGLTGMELWLGGEWGPWLDFADPIFEDPRVYGADLPFLIESPSWLLSTDLVRYVPPGTTTLSEAQLASLGQEIGLSFTGPGMSDLQALMVQAGLAQPATLAPGATPELSLMQAQVLLDSLQVNPATGELQTKDGTILGAVKDVLGTPEKPTFIGRTLGMLAIGGAGLGIASLLTGGGSTFTPPVSPPPTPAAAAGSASLERALGLPAGTLSGTIPGATGAGALSPYLTLGAEQPGAASLERIVRTALAGQANLADLLGGRIGRETLADIGAAPAESAVRGRAFEQLLGQPGQPTLAPGPGDGAAMPTTPLFGGTASLMEPGTLTPMPDAIRAGLEAETLRVLSGEYANPLLARQLADKERVLRATLQGQVGPGYEVSTPGIQTLAENAFYAQMLKEADRRAQLSTLVPLETTRREQEVSLPEQSLARREAIRRSNLSDVLGLTRFGRTEPLAAGTGLASLISPSGLLGAGTAASEEERQYQRNLQTQLALQSFSANEAERARLAQQVGQLFGLAGTVGLGTFRA